MKNVFLGGLLMVIGLGLGCRQSDPPAPHFNRNLAATPGPDYTPNGKLMPIEPMGSDATAYLQDPKSPDLKRQPQAAQAAAGAGTPTAGGTTSAPASLPAESAAPTPGGTTTAPASAPAAK